MYDCLSAYKTAEIKTEAITLIKEGATSLSAAGSEDLDLNPLNLGGGAEIPNPLGS